MRNGIKYRQRKYCIRGGQFRGNHAPFGLKEMQGNATPAEC